MNYILWKHILIKQDNEKDEICKSVHVKDGQV